MFSYKRGNRPESKTARIFDPVRQVVAPVGRQTTLFGRDRQMAVFVTVQLSTTVLISAGILYYVLCNVT